MWGDTVYFSYFICPIQLELQDVLMKGACIFQVSIFGACGDYEASQQLFEEYQDVVEKLYRWSGVPVRWVYFIMIILKLGDIFLQRKQSILKGI